MRKRRTKTCIQTLLLGEGGALLHQQHPKPEAAMLAGQGLGFPGHGAGKLSMHVKPETLRPATALKAYNTIIVLISWGLGC